MAKKKNKNKAPKKSMISDKALPQNILPIGERVEENKNIYISQPVYKQIHSFTRNKTKNESGGMLIGNVVEEFGKTNIIVNGFVEAKFSQGTPTTLTFTHETWDYVHKEIKKRFPEQKIVGWIHTHPNFGIFLSEYDKFIQENFFREDYQIAYVIDPIQKIEGFYFWVGGEITRCRGYYKFDKMGAKIAADESADENESVESKPKFDYKYIIIIILALCSIALLVLNIFKSQKIAALEKKIEQFQNTVVYQEVNPYDFIIEMPEGIYPSEDAQGETVDVSE